MSGLNQAPVGSTRSTAGDGAGEVRDKILVVMEGVHHQLRTPLSRVVGLIDLLLDTPLEDEQRRWVREIQSSAREISDGLDEALSLVEVEAEGVELESIPFSLSTILTAASRRVERQLAERENRVRIVESPDIPDFLLGDAVQLDRTLIHLIMCVSRQLEGETILLRLGQDGRTNGNVRVLFEIDPEGSAAIPPVKVLEASIDFELARALVKAMGGEVMDSDPANPKSPLRFWLPFSEPHHPGRRSTDRALPNPPSSHRSTGSPSEPTLGQPAEALRILLAEDDLVLQILTRKLLELRGHEVHVVLNGRDAVEAVKLRAFDVVLMDLEMPELDGISATREIRSAAGCSGPPIVAYTAHALSEVRARCKNAGMDGFLAKPVNAEDLYQELERWPHRSDG